MRQIETMLFLGVERNASLRKWEVDILRKEKLNSSLKEVTHQSAAGCNGKTKAVL